MHRQRAAKSVVDDFVPDVGMFNQGARLDISSSAGALSSLADNTIYERLSHSGSGRYAVQCLNNHTANIFDVSENQHIKRSVEWLSISQNELNF